MACGTITADIPCGVDCMFVNQLAGICICFMFGGKLPSVGALTPLGTLNITWDVVALGLLVCCFEVGFGALTLACEAGICAGEVVCTETAAELLGTCTVICLGVCAFIGTCGC